MSIIDLSDDTMPTEWQQSGVVLLDFWAPWCIPCRALEPVLKEISKRYAGRVTIAKVDVDACPLLRARFGIMSVPTLMLMTQGVEPVRLTDMRRLAIQARLDGLLAQVDSAASMDSSSCSPADSALGASKGGPLAAVLEAILANIDDRAHATREGPLELPPPRSRSSLPGGSDGEVWSLSYYKWLVNDDMWGLASHLRTAQERSMLERLQQLQALGAKGAIEIDPWLALKDDVAAYAQETREHGGVDLGPALGTFADFEAGLGLAALHDYVEGLAVQRCAGDETREGGVTPAAERFSFAAATRLSQLLRQEADS